MEMMQRKRKQVAEAAVTEPVGMEPEQAPPPVRQVRVIAGADVLDMDLAGRSVGEARAVVQTLLGISARARALVDGREVEETRILEAGGHLEFVRHAGSKGARTGGGAGSTIELAGDRAVWRRNGDVLCVTTVRDLLTRVAARGEAPQTWRLNPRQVRLMVERNGGRTTGVVIEMPPGPREVRWVSDATRDAEGLGRNERRRLSFPWLVLVIVFVDGELSNLQQAFFRTAPIGSLSDPLCYTNLLNVARGYDQESWVCLVNIERSLARLPWEQRVQVVTRHFWEAAYTRSSEIHEGNSYWSCARGLDPRLASADAWERATREHPYFTLEVPWRPTGHTLGSTLTRMLDMVSPWRPIEGADQLATLIQQEGSAP